VESAPEADAEFVEAMMAGVSEEQNETSKPTKEEVKERYC